MTNAVPPGLQRITPAVDAAGTITVTFITNGRKSVTVAKDSNLLRISLREQGGIPFKCGGGLCGTCRCRIESGLAHTDAVKPKERRHLTEADLASGCRMACQTFVNGDIAVSWLPREPAGSAAPATLRQPSPRHD